MKIIIMGRGDLQVPVLVGCGQICLLFNQISGFFDQQYIWNKSIDVLVFYEWGSFIVFYQWKAATETSTMSWMRPASPLVFFSYSSDYIIL